MTLAEHDFRPYRLGVCLDQYELLQCEQMKPSLYVTLARLLAMSSLPGLFDMFLDYLGGQSANEAAPPSET